jgi:hypothetical protein
LASSAYWSVDEPGRAGRLVRILAVGPLRAGGQYLHLDSGPVHQPQPSLEVGAAARADAARLARVGLAQI